MAYRWNSQYEWLEEVTKKWSASGLRSALLEFALAAGNDEIQDRYERDMDADGFFDELPEK